MGGYSQAEFAWVPEWKGMSRLFVGPQKRQDVADGRSQRVFVFPWGFT
jgi:hypothetical protein